MSAFLSAVCSRKRTGTPPSGTTLGYEDTFTHKHRMQAPLAQAHTHTYRRTHPSAHARRRTAHVRMHGRDCPRAHAHARTHLLIRINMRMCARTHPEDTRSRTRSCKQVYQDTKNAPFFKRWKLVTLEVKRCSLCLITHSAFFGKCSSVAAKNSQ